MALDGSTRIPARRLPSLDPTPTTGRGRRAARRIAVGIAAVMGLGLTALAAHRIGVTQVAQSIIDSDIKWVVIASALMCAAMFARAASWVAIVRAALPNRRSGAATSPRR